MIDRAELRKEAVEIKAEIVGEKIDLVGGDLRTWGQFAASLLSVATVYSAFAPLVNLITIR